METRTVEPEYTKKPKLYLISLKVALVLNIKLGFTD